MEEVYWIWLTLLEGVGPVGAHKLIDKYGTSRKIYNEWNQEEALYGTKSRESILAEAEKIYEKCNNENISVITYDSHYYHNSWKDFLDFPVLLYIKGNSSILLQDGIGIVGPRRCTHEAKGKAIAIALEAINCNKTVVSGMAKGVDSYAHTAALKSGGGTIAALGNGVDICYPKEHIKLYEAICEKGAVISEYPPGTEPKRYNFPKRNRIISGISSEIYIVEAGEKSGTITTRQAALKYGKIVINV